MQEQKLTGYPSIDKPWMKYYSMQIIDSVSPECSIYDYLCINNKDHPNDVAINYYSKRINYKDLFQSIKAAASAFTSVGVQKDEIVTLCTVTLPETIYSLYGLNMIGAVANMTDPRTSADGLREYIKEVDSRIVVCIDVVYEWRFAKTVSSASRLSIHTIFSIYYHY